MFDAGRKPLEKEGRIARYKSQEEGRDGTDNRRNNGTRQGGREQMIQQINDNSRA